MGYDIIVSTKTSTKKRQTDPPPVTTVPPSVIHLHHVRVCKVIRIAVFQMSLLTLAACYFFNYLYLEAVSVTTLIINQQKKQKDKKI